MCVAVWLAKFYKFEGNEIIEYSESFLSIDLWLSLQVLGMYLSDCIQQFVIE